MLFLLDHLHIHRRFFNWFLGGLLSEILDYGQSCLDFFVIIHRFEPFIDIFCLLFHMLMVHGHCYCFLLWFNISFHCLMSFGLLSCYYFLGCGCFLDDSCLFCNIWLWVSLLFSLCIDLGTDLNSLLLMNLFMRLNHFNIVNLILVRLLLWEILNDSQCCMSVVFVKFSTASQMCFCIDNVISICIDLLSLLQLYMSITTWWFWFSNMGLSLCKMGHIDRVADWHCSMLWNIGTC